jgi:hypothetical protein
VEKYIRKLTLLFAEIAARHIVIIVAMERVYNDVQIVRKFIMKIMMRPIEIVKE